MLEPARARRAAVLERAAANLTRRSLCVHCFPVAGRLVLVRRFGAWGGRRRGTPGGAQPPWKQRIGTGVNPDLHCKPVGTRPVTRALAWLQLAGGPAGQLPIVTPPSSNLPHAGVAIVLPTWRDGHLLHAALRDRPPHSSARAERVSGARDAASWHGAGGQGQETHPPPTH